ncbi:unnamed protein product [Ectocarpus sp. 6 AP-2014]
MVVTKKHRRCATSPLDGEDVVRVISTFVPTTEFAFFAIASKLCRHVWGKRGMNTQAVSVHTTPMQLRWCFDMGLKFSDNVVVNAAAIGRIDLMSVAGDVGCPFTRRVSFAAARGGYVDALKYARTRGSTVNADVANVAALRGHLHVLKWLFSVGCEFNASTCYVSAKNGHHQCLKYLRDVGCEWDELTCSAAARWGHFALLKWAMQQGCHFGQRVVHAAAQGGNLSILTYVESCIRRRGDVVDTADSSLCTAAAAGGHVHILQWALANGRCIWSADTVRMAALHGHLHVFRWGMENGCYMYRGVSVMRWAARGGHVVLLDWLLGNGFIADARLTVLAACRGHLGVLQWAYSRQLALFNENTWNAAVSKGPEIMQWLREKGCPGSFGT